jgi:hypothetical protein
MDGHLGIVQVIAVSVLDMAEIDQIDMAMLGRGQEEFAAIGQGHAGNYQAQS